jgi:hypothetical protein
MTGTKELKLKKKPEKVVHAYNPSILEAKARGQEPRLLSQKTNKKPQTKIEPNKTKNQNKPQQPNQPQTHKTERKNNSKNKPIRPARHLISNGSQHQQYVYV